MKEKMPCQHIAFLLLGHTQAVCLAEPARCTVYCDVGNKYQLILKSYNSNHCRGIHRRLRHVVFQVVHVNTGTFAC